MNIEDIKQIILGIYLEPSRGINHKLMTASTVILLDRLTSRNDCFIAPLSSQITLV